MDYNGCSSPFFVIQIPQSTGASSMTKLFQRLWLITAQVLSTLVSVILVTYTVALLIQTPYAGFHWDSPSKEIRAIYVPSAGMLKVGDRMAKIGLINMADYDTDLRLTLFDNVKIGEIVPITVWRDDQLITVSWKFPGYSSDEFWGRMSNQWWLAYPFWIAGILGLWFLRPKDTGWRLFIAFNFLTAIWLIASSVSRSHTWYSAIMLRSAIWLYVPVSWHLHWELPRPLRQFPKSVWWVLYGVAGLLAVAEWFKLVAINAYVIGLLLAFAGSTLLFIIHFIFHRNERRSLFPILVAVLFVFGMLTVLSSLYIVTLAPPFLLTLLTMPILPAAYFWAVHRRRFSTRELRSNDVFITFIFLGLLGAFVLFALSFLKPYLDSPGANIVVAVGLALLVALIAITGFAPFKRFVERRVLGIALPKQELIETYSARITTGLKLKTLVALLTDEVLPSLLIRQSALIEINDGIITVIYAQNVEARQLPRYSDLPVLLDGAGRYHVPAENGSLPFGWAHLVLALSVEQQPMGVWLLGRHDPDDYYSPQEIKVLQSLTHQTAIALTNISQAEQLRALYQRDIDQREVERASLACELHDRALNELAVFKEGLGDDVMSPNSQDSFEKIIASLRQTISDLRPRMLDYGLYSALVSLVDALQDRVGDSVKIVLEVPEGESSVRYKEQVELYTYRIVQQACENALKHAQPRTLTVRGRLEAQSFHFAIEDDGTGFELAGKNDLAKLQGDGHFGLVGMYERASIIGANLHIASAAGHGTRVEISWRFSS
ncbi:hypothetical protein HY772_06200 [Candidatus Woesearchaeota archaeon]|nr:hypothetical protein [Candidatus Woesearchaeota archaeon]